jgi:hypothetical protein
MALSHYVKRTPDVRTLLRLAKVERGEITDQTSGNRQHHGADPIPHTVSAPSYGESFALLNEMGSHAWGARPPAVPGTTAVGCRFPPPRGACSGRSAFSLSREPARHPQRPRVAWRRRSARRRAGSSARRLCSPKY